MHTAATKEFVRGDRCSSSPAAMLVLAVGSVSGLSSATCWLRRVRIAFPHLRAVANDYGLFLRTLDYRCGGSAGIASSGRGAPASHDRWGDHLTGGAR